MFNHQTIRQRQTTHEEQKESTIDTRTNQPSNSHKARSPDQDPAKRHDATPTRCQHDANATPKQTTNQSASIRPSVRRSVPLLPVDAQFIDHRDPLVAVVIVIGLDAVRALGGDQHEAVVPIGKYMIWSQFPVLDHRHKGRKKGEGKTHGVYTCIERGRNE